MAWLKNLLRGVAKVTAHVVDALAACAEMVTDAVKDVWAATKPYIREYIQPVLGYFHRISSSQWVRSSLVALDRLLEFGMRITESNAARNFEAAIRWTIDIARRFSDWILDSLQVATAKVHLETLKAIANVAPTEQRSVNLAMFINNFKIVQKELVERISSDPATNGQIKDSAVTSLDQYLRLKATYRLMEDVTKRIGGLEAMTDIAEDDMFLLEVAVQMLSDRPELTDAQLQQLDTLIARNYHTSLTAFVYAELITVWESTVSTRNAVETEVRKAYVHAVLTQRNYKIDQAIGLKRDTDAVIAEKALRLTNELNTLAATLARLKGPRSQESVITAGLEATIESARKRLEEYHDYTRDLTKCADAARGFVEYAKDPAAFGRPHLVEEMNKVARIIIQCAEWGTPLDRMSVEDRNTLSDFALIFHVEITP